MARLDALLRYLKDDKVDGLHLLAGLPPRLRQHGAFVPVAGWEAVEGDELRGLLREIVPEERWAELQRGQEAEFSYVLDGARVRGRLCEGLPGLSAVLRLPREQAPSLEELRLPAALAELPGARGGVVVVAGPGGAGKSTLLAALVGAINDAHARHVVTIEDPISHVHRSKRSVVVQREVGTDTGSREAALRLALRQDVDVLLIDPLFGPGADAVSEPGLLLSVIEAAEAGVLVLVSVSRGTTAGALAALCAGLPAQAPRLLGAALRALVVQRLCPQTDGKGLVPAHEILLGGPALPDVLDEGRPAELLLYLLAGRAQGMQTLEESLQRHVQAGLITREEMARQLGRRPLTHPLQDDGAL